MSMRFGIHEILHVFNLKINKEVNYKLMILIPETGMVIQHGDGHVHTAESSE
jgi:hypothetical protein